MYNLDRKFVAKLYTVPTYGTKLTQINTLDQYDNESDQDFLDRAERVAKINHYVHSIELKK